METGVAFRSTTHFDVCPVDFVSRAILHLALERPEKYRTYHLLNPDIKTYSQVWGMIRSHGYAITGVEQEDYKRMLFDGGLTVNGVEYKSATTKGFRWWFQREIFDFSQSAVTDCSWTARLLADAGITCPALDEKLIGDYVDAGIREGYFPLPEARAACSMRAQVAREISPSIQQATPSVAFGVQNL